MAESLIFEDGQVNFKGLLGKAEAELIRSGTQFAIYRLIVDGKYFLFKTPATEDKRLRELLRREYELSIGCAHPHIVHVTAFGEILPGKTGIVMEYIDGSTLSEFLAGNPSNEKRLKIFGQLLSATEYLHKKGIVHNDLKPDNILISRSTDSLKLIDFGLSDDDTHIQIKTPGCSPEYAAPELKNSRQSDIRSDIYSLGRIMKDIFPGKHGRIVRKSMAADPEKRYEDVEGLRRAFKRRRLPATVAGLSVCLIILAAIVFFTFPGRKQFAEPIKPVIVADSVAIPQEVGIENEELPQIEPEDKSQPETAPVVEKITVDNSKQKPPEINLADFKDEMQKLSDKTVARIRSLNSVSELSVVLTEYGDEALTIYNSYKRRAGDEEDASLLLREYNEARTKAVRVFQDASAFLYTTQQKK